MNRNRGLYWYDVNRAAIDSSLIAENGRNIDFYRSDDVNVTNADIRGTSSFTKYLAHPPYYNKPCRSSGYYSPVGFIMPTYLYRNANPYRGVRFENVHFSLFDQSDVCSPSIPIIFRSEKLDGHWNYMSSFTNVTFNGTKFIDAMDADESGITDIIISDPDGKSNPAKSRCYSIIIKTDSSNNAASSGPFHIEGYGEIPNNCYSTVSAQCELEICNTDRLVLSAGTSDGWYFSIEGDIGSLLSHETVSGGTHYPPFPTRMDTNQYDVVQAYELFDSSQLAAGSFVSNKPYLTNLARGKCELYHDGISYCEGACYRTVRLVVDQGGTNGYDLKVTRDDGAVTYIPSIYEYDGYAGHNYNRSLYEHYPRKYAASLPFGKYELEFFENGSPVWPKYVYEIWEGVPDCEGYASVSDITVVERALVNGECDDLIVNGDMEDGVAGWLHRDGNSGPKGEGYLLALPGRGIGGSKAIGQYLRENIIVTYVLFFSHTVILSVFRLF